MTYPVPPSPRDAALEMLFALLEAAIPEATVRRNETLPEEINGRGHVLLNDGTGSPEILIGTQPPIYSWSWTIDLLVAAQSSDYALRTARLGQMLTRISGILLENPRPIDDVHAMIISTDVDQTLQVGPGTTPISVATLGVLLEYSTTNPTG